MAFIIRGRRENKTSANTHYGMSVELEVIRKGLKGSVT